MNASQRFIETGGEIYFDPIKCLLYRADRSLFKGWSHRCCWLRRNQFCARRKYNLRESEREKNYTPCKFTDLINSSLESRATRSEVWTQFCASNCSVIFIIGDEKNKKKRRERVFRLEEKKKGRAKVVHRQR